MSEIIGPIITLAVMGGILGFGLAYASEKLKVEADPRIKGIHERLPNLDCGACGYPGCEPFAEAIVEGKVKNLSQCKPGNKKHYQAILQFIKENPDEEGILKDVKE